MKKINFTGLPIIIKDFLVYLDVIKTSDYIIDLGPEGGDNGGKFIAKGTPEEVSKNNKSYTGKYLKKIL